MLNFRNHHKLSKVEEATEIDRQQTDTYFEEERREKERGNDSEVGGRS